MTAVDFTINVNDHFGPSANAAMKRGKVTITSATDFVAKIDVTGLPSKTKFVFVFSDGSVTSDMYDQDGPTGDQGVDDMVYAFFSCSHFLRGNFHSYHIFWTIEDLWRSFGVIT